MLFLAGCLCLCLQMPSCAMQFKKEDTAQHINAKCRPFFGAIDVDKCFTLILNNFLVYQLCVQRILIKILGKFLKIWQDFLFLKKKSKNYLFLTSDFYIFKSGEFYKESNEFFY